MLDQEPIIEILQNKEDSEEVKTLVRLRYIAVAFEQALFQRNWERVESLSLKYCSITENEHDKSLSGFMVAVVYCEIM